MARIRPYERQVSAQGDLPTRNANPSDVGGAGLTNLGEGVQHLGQSLGQVERILNEQRTRQEVTDASVSLTELGTELVVEHDELAKRWKPGDPPLSETFGGIVKARLDKLQGAENGEERFTTQAGLDTFKTHAAQLVNHFTGLTLRTDAHLAGEAAKEQHRTLVDNMGNFLQTHPAYFSLRRDEMASMIHNPDGVYGRLTELQKADLIRAGSEQLAISAVQGFIRKTPNVALETLNDPMLKQSEQYGWIAQYIPNEKMQPLIQRAETEVRALDVERARVEADVNRQRIIAARSAEATLVEKLALHMDDPKQPMLSARDVMESNLMELDPEKGKSLLTLIHAWSKEDPNRPVHTNPVVEHTLFRRIHLPDGDPKKIVDTDLIYQAYERGQLSFTDMDKLRKEVVEARTPEGSVFGREKSDFLKGMEPRITKPGPFGVYTDPTTPEQFANFKRDLEQTITEYRKAGKNPRVLFDRNSPDYFGNRAPQYEAKGFGSMMPGPSFNQAPSPTAPRKSLDDIFGGKP